MSYFTEETSAAVVNGRIGPEASPRLRRVMTSLVEHLHAFIRDVELTEEEWATAIDFLTATGQICSDSRQEFILLSDTLGVSMLVDTVNHRNPNGATETTVFGPFHVENAPERDMGTNISLDGKGEVCLYSGRVLDLDGRPIEMLSSMSGPTMKMASMTSSSRISSRRSTIADGSAPVRTGLMPFAASSRCPIRSPMMGRSARCWPPWAAIPGDRRICISWSPRRAAVA